MVAEIAQVGLKSLLKDEVTSDAVVCINSSELVHISISPLQMRVEKVPNVLVGHCVLFT